MSQCWPLQMPPTPKAVLISLADNANDDGVCWPSIATISQRTCFSERAVQAAIRWLESHGAVKANRENGRHTHYLVAPSDYREPPQELHPNPRSRCTPQQMHPAADAPQPPQELHPTPAADAPHPRRSCGGPPQEVPSNRKEPSYEPSKNRKEKFDPLGALITLGVDQQTAEDWLSLRKSKKAPVTRTALDAIEREAEAAGLSLDSALQTACQRGWVGFKAEWVANEKSARAGPKFSY
jgi:hypothetical protein